MAGRTSCILSKKKVLPTIVAMITERLLCQVCQASCFHRWRRALVMPGLVGVASFMQCGGLAGLATDVASHLLGQTVEHHRTRKRSAIFVFVDVIAAFYNVVRSLVTDISPLLQGARHMDDGSGLPSALAATSLDAHVLNSVTAKFVAAFFFNCRF